MAFTQEEETLFDNQWTKAIVNRKEIWESFARSNGYEIIGKFSNYGVEFNIPLSSDTIHIQVYGHRNFVNLHGAFKDVFNEVFEIKMYSKKKMPFTEIKSFKKGLFGWLLSLFHEGKKVELNEKYNLGIKNVLGYRLIKSMGLLSLEEIDKFYVDSKKVILRTSKLPASEHELNQVLKIIENLKTLHNKG